MKRVTCGGCTEIQECAQAGIERNDPACEHFKSVDTLQPTDRKYQVGCGWCIHEQVCAKRQNRNTTTRELAKRCKYFVHYQEGGEQ